MKLPSIEEVLTDISRIESKNRVLDTIHKLEVELLHMGQVMDELERMIEFTLPVGFRKDAALMRDQALAKLARLFGEYTALSELLK